MSLRGGANTSQRSGAKTSQRSGAVDDNQPVQRRKATQETPIIATVNDALSPGLMRQKAK